MNPRFQGPKRANLTDGASSQGRGQLPGAAAEGGEVCSLWESPSGQSSVYVHFRCVSDSSILPEDACNENPAEV